ncbi:hypothetical protein [Cellulomonas fimi]|uniref:Uncharacterized protein n=1 Tax=Cellulomonas fimi (strain ATCC 484 / DSM 20113 / JCM 1341 / CCUG 24087 / LMG 16345 / NBRC 15513 / NCIMB 8980 / NCTC 7547 / NRS-133) TaxID=590998 RepID=F4H5F3_CELFA|nr:hypothetical protein [Cellulomonas fimi]AEE47876.1 hypothetical protein Celf_3770 [Cellulomonas fimi ATCC 484]NNH05987.1 hypothetical protein [Cellulomonas fimi]VEH37050.1 Uncharacterised protein [Cellulomonas fimi]
MTHHDHLTLLHDLDVADPHPDPRSPRARAAVERILRADPPAPAPVPTRSHRLRRVAVAAGGIAALAVGGVLAPPLTGGDTAYATWTPQATVATGVQRADAGEACRDRLRDAADDDAALDSARVAVAEQRGTWTTVVLAGDGGFSGLCVDDGSAGLFDTMLGSVGTALVASPGPREVTATDLGVGATSAGELSLVAGIAGDEVAAVRLVSPTVGVVTATVGDGRFVLWYPGDELLDASTRGVDLELTFADGSTGAATVRL